MPRLAALQLPEAPSLQSQVCQPRQCVYSLHEQGILHGRQCETVKVALTPLVYGKVRTNQYGKVMSRLCKCWLSARHSRCGESRKYSCCLWPDLI